jgi:hypothetical protein
LSFPFIQGSVVNASYTSNSTLTFCNAVECEEVNVLLPANEREFKNYAANSDHTHSLGIDSLTLALSDNP